MQQNDFIEDTPEEQSEISDHNDLNGEIQKKISQKKYLYSPKQIVPLKSGIKLQAQTEDQPNDLKDSSDMSD